MNVRFLICKLLFILILFTSCEADIDIKNISSNIALKPSLIVPIAGASVTLGQILSNNYNGANLDLSDDLEISYINRDSAEFKFRDFNFVENALPLSKNIYPSPDKVLLFQPNTTLPAVVVSDYLNFGVNSTQSSDRIDSMKVTSATLSVTVLVTPELQNIDPDDLTLSIILPTEKVRMLNGKSNTISVTFTSYGQPTIVTIPNLMLNMSNGATGIPIQIKVDAKNDDLPVVITQNSVITCNLALQQLDCSVVYGNFDTKSTVSSIHQRGLDFYKNFPNGLLKFTDPQIHIAATSNIGTYLNFDVDYIKAFLKVDSTKAPVFAWFNGHTTNSVSDKFNIKSTYPGLIINKNFKTFDKNWGETNQLFVSENKPDMIEYKFSVNVDKTKAQSDPTPNFITVDSKIKVQITTIIPLQLNKGSYYYFRDTIPNIFDGIANTLDNYSNDKISSTSVIFNVKNGLPVNSQLSLKFLDSGGTELKTDFQKEYIIEAGKVDATGIVQLGSETKQTIQVLLTKEQLTELRKAKTLAYSVRIDGQTIDSNIHFTKINTFDVKVGLFVNSNLNGKI